MLILRLQKGVGSRGRGNAQFEGYDLKKGGKEC